MIFFIRAGTGIAGRRKGNICVQPLADAAGHLPRDLGAHRALFRQQRRVHAQKRFLDRIGVGDHAAQIDRRAARDIRQELAEQAARAALRRGERQILFFQKGDRARRLIHSAP